MPKLSVVAVVVGVLGLGLLGVLGYSTIHPPEDPQFWSVLTAVGAIVASLATYVRSAKTSTAVSAIADDVTTVKEQTDGTTTSLVGLTDRVLVALQTVAADPDAARQVGAFLEEIRQAAAASPLGVTLPLPAPKNPLPGDAESHPPTPPTA